LEANGVQIVEAKSDEAGNFRISAKPGVYDIRIRQGVLFGNRVFAADLHEGEQSLQPLRTRLIGYGSSDGSDTTDITMGEVVEIKSSFAYDLKHPWSFLKRLARKI
jgi:hypothetical protein